MSRPKRQYKKYLQDDNEPVPKRSRMYYNSEQSDAARARQDRLQVAERVEHNPQNQQECQQINQHNLQNEEMEILLDPCIEAIEAGSEIEVMEEMEESEAATVSDQTYESSDLSFEASENASTVGSEIEEMEESEAGPVSDQSDELSDYQQAGHAYENTNERNNRLENQDLNLTDSAESEADNVSDQNGESREVDCNLENTSENNELQNQDVDQYAEESEADAAADQTEQLRESQVFNQQLELHNQENSEEVSPCSRAVFMCNRPRVRHEELVPHEQAEVFQPTDIVEDEYEPVTIDVYNDQTTDTEMETNEENLEEQEEEDIGEQQEETQEENDNQDEVHERNDHEYEGRNQNDNQDEVHEGDDNRHERRNQDQQQPHPNPPTHLKLRQELVKEKFTAPIVTPVNASPAETLLMTLAMAEKNNLTFKAFVDSVKLINSLFLGPVIPNSAYLLDKLLNSSEGISKFFYCKQCSFAFGIQDNLIQRVLECTECGCSNDISDLTKATYFVLFPLSQQIELLFMDDLIRNQLSHPKDLVKKCIPNVKTDLYDGKCYKNFAASLPESDDKVISLTGATDGSPLFTSSNFSIWPYFASVNELPPMVRMKNLLLGGLWFGNKKPPMDLFLEPLVQQLRKLEEGFTLQFNGEEVIMHAYTIACCVDSGARGAVQGLNTHSGYFSCNWCEIPGKYADKIIFPFPETPPKKRSHASVVEQARECVNDEKLAYVYGVQYLSPLANLSKFDIVDSMVLDYAHNVSFGISRSFLTEWLSNTSRGFYIGAPDDLKELDRKILLLTPPIEVRRPIRKVTDCAHWNAREYENWTSVYSIPVLTGIWPMKFVTHWTYLVQAMFLLSRQSVTREDINNAHKLTIHFERDAENIYDESSMTYNLHIFGHHMAENVVNWGPAWAISSLCFENGIKEVKELIHAQRGVPHQIHRSINYKQAARILRRWCRSQKTEAFESDLASKPIKMTKYFPVSECVLTGSFSPFRPTREEDYLIRTSHFNINSCESSVFNRMIAQRCVFTTDQAGVSKKYNNSCATTTDKKSIIIKKIVLDKATEKVYIFCVEVLANTFLRLPQGVRLAPSDHCLRIVSSIGERLFLLSIKSLKTVNVFFKLDDKIYVGEFPNVNNVF